MKIFNVGYSMDYMEEEIERSTNAIYLIAAEDEQQAINCAEKMFLEEEGECSLGNIYETEQREGDIPAVLASNV